MWRSTRFRTLRSLAAQLFALQALVVAIVLAGAGVAAYLALAQVNRDAVGAEMLAAARTLAAGPDVRAGLAAPDPTAVLQPLAERVRRDTGTDFVVVMTPGGTRWTHPDPAQIGRHFLGTISGAAAGGADVETYTGTLGPSVRAVVPVTDGGRVVGLVAVGRGVTAVASNLGRQLPVLAGAVAVALALAAAGAGLVSRWLRRTTLDLGPAELARRNEYHDAVLHAVAEGLVLLDREGRVQLVNDEARRLLDLPPDAEGHRIDELGLPGALGEALAAGVPRDDELHLTADRVVVVNQQPANRPGRRLGTVVTLRDHTDLQALAGELRAVRGVADSLSAQAHEAANRLHTVVALIELGRAEEALHYASTELHVAQALTDAVLAAIEVPELAALVVAKAAEAGERGVDLRLEPDTHVQEGVAGDLVTIVGNLLDNAVDAALAAPAPRWVALGGRTERGELRLRVTDSGPGLDPERAQRAFTRGWSTKGQGRGLGLALVGRAVARRGGAVRFEPGSGFLVVLPAGQRV